MVMIPIKQPLELPSAGWHRATILTVEDIGRQKSNYGVSSRNMVDIAYRIEDQTDSHGKPMIFYQGETNTIMGGRGKIQPSKLYKILTEGLGITPDKSGAFDSDVMKDRDLWINIQYSNKTEGNKTQKQKTQEYANIVGWSQRKPVIVEVVKEVARELVQELEENR